METKKTYNKSLIFKHTWKIYKAQPERTMAKFSECLKSSWHLAKVNPMALEPINITDLYNKHYKEVLNYAMFKIRNQMVAEEIADDTFIKAMKYLSAYDKTKSKITTWLKTICNSCIIDYFRKDRSNNDLKISDFVNEDGKEWLEFESDNDCMKTVENDNIRENVERVIDMLKPKYKKIATLFFIKQMEYAEIAEICAVPMGTVKGMIVRCRKQLQNELKELYQELLVA